jgi:hypothetical protein
VNFFLLCFMKSSLFIISFVISLAGYLKLSPFEIYVVPLLQSPLS